MEMTIVWTDLDRDNLVVEVPGDYYLIGPDRWYDAFTFEGSDGSRTTVNLSQVLCMYTLPSEDE
jgi:hypothetical protein